MHLQVIIGFALLIWWPDQRPFEPLANGAAASTLVMLAQPVILLLAAQVLANRCLRKLHAHSGSRNGADAQKLHHRATVVLRWAALAGFVAGIFLTDWAPLIRGIGWLGSLPGLVDLVVAGPLLINLFMVLLGSYKIDRALHQEILQDRTWEGVPTANVWSRGAYLNFHVRHHLLVVTVPMVLILASFELAGEYQRQINNALRVNWAAEVVPGIAAAIVFIIAPLLLRHIWQTRPLPNGTLRTRLETISRRVGLRYRDILVWQSGSMVVNAAVMGLFPRVRYVLLSDGLLDAMSDEQVEAVFGHEVGHIRHRHIPYFLLFAVCSMLILSAIIEALRIAVERQYIELSVTAIQAIGFVSVFAMWGVGFGWVSRRFERQADLFGAGCVAADGPSACRVPCSRHGDDGAPPPPDDAICATGADIFAGTLDRVAVLNGIPHEEPSWRHSSIASRIAFLRSLAADPSRARSFTRTVRSIKRTLFGAAVVGSLIALIYVWDHPIYGIRRDRARMGTSPVSAHVTPRFSTEGP